MLRRHSRYPIVAATDDLEIGRFGTLEYVADAHAGTVRRREESERTEASTSGDEGGQYPQRRVDTLVPVRPDCIQAARKSEDTDRNN